MTKSANDYVILFFTFLCHFECYINLKYYFRTTLN